MDFNKVDILDTNQFSSITGNATFDTDGELNCDFTAGDIELVLLHPIKSYAWLEFDIQSLSTAAPLVLVSIWAIPDQVNPFGGGSHIDCGVRQLDIRTHRMPYVGQVEAIVIKGTPGDVVKIKAVRAVQRSNKFNMLIDTVSVPQAFDATWTYNPSTGQYVSTLAPGITAIIGVTLPASPNYAFVRVEQDANSNGISIGIGDGTDSGPFVSHAPVVEFFLDPNFEATKVKEFNINAGIFATTIKVTVLRGTFASAISAFGAVSTNQGQVTQAAPTLVIPSTQVDSFNGRFGAVVLSTADITGALGFTPYSAANPAGFINAVTTAMVLAGLGFVPIGPNLTGPITSLGNATAVASQTGTGTKFVMDTSPTISNPTFTGAITANSSLAVTGAISGTGFAAYLASPPPIGSTVRGTGAFTTLSASSGFSVTGGRSLHQANNESFAVGSSFGAGGGLVYFGAASISATPDAVISNSGGSTLVTIGNAGGLTLANGGLSLPAGQWNQIGGQLTFYSDNALGLLLQAPAVSNKVSLRDSSGTTILVATTGSITTTGLLGVNMAPVLTGTVSQVQVAGGIRATTNTQRGLDVIQNITNFVDSIWFNRILHTETDFAAGSNITNVLNIHHDMNGTGATTGSRNTFEILLNFNHATNAANPLRFYCAFASTTNATASDGGTGPGNYKGALYGGNFVVSGTAAAVAFANVTGLEVNTNFVAGASMSYKSGIQIAGFATDAIQGTDFDAMISLSGISGSVVWKNGILFSAANGQHPIGLTGTGNLFATQGAGGAVNGIEISSYTFSTWEIHTPHFGLTAAGNLLIGAAASFGTGAAGVISMLNATGVPSTSPANTGQLYVQAGALKYRGSAGTVTTVAVA